MGRLMLQPWLNSLNLYDAKQPGLQQGEGQGGLEPPQNFGTQKKLQLMCQEIYNLNKIINVQQSVLNADAKSAFYNFTTFNRVRHLLSH